MERLEIRIEQFESCQRRKIVTLELILYFEINFSFAETKNYHPSLKYSMNTFNNDNKNSRAMFQTHRSAGKIFVPLIFYENL